VPARHDSAAAERIDRLAAVLDGLGVQVDEDVDQRAHHRTARNEIARARGTASVDDWIEATELWRTAQRPREEAYCLLRVAECHADARRREKAVAAATAALEIAERLGAAPIVSEIDALLRRTRLSVAPAPRAPADDRPFGLTDREFEVLTLLGTGATNRQIARKLFISDRTVGVHVSRVLHKLQVTNRAQAAAVAVKVTR
jgi:DNA-binding CsgD family transcriptional regulator